MTTILVGTDLSPDARPATQWACELARRLTQQGADKVHLVVAHIVGIEELNTRRIVSENTEEKERDHLTGEVHSWLSGCDLDGVDYSVELHAGSAAQALAQLARQKQADWLVVGQSGKGRLARMFLGTTAERLAFDPPCMLALVHERPFPWEGPLKMVAAVDLGGSAERALAAGAALVNSTGGEAQLLYVLELPKMGTGLADTGTLPETLSAYLKESTESAQDDLNKLLKHFSRGKSGSGPVRADVEVRPGYPSHEILHVLKEVDAHLLTIGTHGRSRISRFFLGSVGRGVIKQVPCTVILAPPMSENDES